MINYDDVTKENKRKQFKLAANLIIHSLEALNLEKQMNYLI